MKAKADSETSVTITQAELAALHAEIALLRDAIRAQDERDIAASEKAGELPFGCDTSDHLADCLLEARADLAACQHALMNARWQSSKR